MCDHTKNFSNFAGVNLIKRHFISTSTPIQSLPIISCHIQSFMHRIFPLTRNLLPINVYATNIHDIISHIQSHVGEIRMEKIAFVMQLKPGYEAEYEKRHDEIWPELQETLKQAGVFDYSIYLERSTGKLFAVLKRREDHTMEQLPLDPIVRKWWAFMADIMDTHTDNRPVSEDLDCVFHLD